MHRPSIKPFITAQVFALSLVLVIGGLLLAAGDPVHALPDERQIASQVEPLLKDGSYLGIVVCIMGPKDRQVFGFGATSRDRIDKPSGDTVFPLASITKTFSRVLFCPTSHCEELSNSAIRLLITCLREISSQANP